MSEGKPVDRRTPYQKMIFKAVVKKILANKQPPKKDRKPSGEYKENRADRRMGSRRDKIREYNKTHHIQLSLRPKLTPLVWERDING